jgi:hypothetical protein
MAGWRNPQIAPTFDIRRTDWGSWMIGEQRAVRAFMKAEELVRGSLKVELRSSDPTSDPRSGRLLPVPPIVILWWEERPLAVRLRVLVALSRFPANDRLANLLEDSLAGAGVPVQRVPEAALWRLFAAPPRPRLAEHD